MQAHTTSIGNTMAKAKNGNGKLTITKTYSFVDKDPSLDVMSSLMQSSGKTVKQLAQAGSPATSTLYNWRNGKTKRPQFCSIVRTARATGGDVVIIDRPKNVIKLPRQVGTRGA
jgi:hypothetical protein